MYNNRHNSRDLNHHHHHHQSLNREGRWGTYNKTVTWRASCVSCYKRDVCQTLLIPTDCWFYTSALASFCFRLFHLFRLLPGGKSVVLNRLLVCHKHNGISAKFWRAIFLSFFVSFYSAAVECFFNNLIIPLGFLPREIRALFSPKKWSTEAQLTIQRIWWKGESTACIESRKLPEWTFLTDLTVKGKTKTNDKWT